MRWPRTSHALVRGEQGRVHGPDAAAVAASPMTEEHDNLRAALEWAIANDDAETALMIAGGCELVALARPGTAAEGARWLDDAFVCAGPVTRRRPARLALAGRGLLRFDRR